MNIINIIEKVFNLNVNRGDSFLLVKISTDLKYDFYKEHMQIIDDKGYVWFCRFGKTNLLISSISNSGNYIFIRDSKKNDNRTYVAKFSTIIRGVPNDNVYPKYYDDVQKEKNLWFQFTELKEINPDIVDATFRLYSSGNDLSSAYKSMCSNFYILSKKIQKF